MFHYISDFPCHLYNTIMFLTNIQRFINKHQIYFVKQGHITYPTPLANTPREVTRAKVAALTSGGFRTPFTHFFFNLFHAGVKCAKTPQLP